jgi:hypothetical protein
LLDGGVEDVDPGTAAHTVLPGPSSPFWRRALPAVASALITLALAAAAYVVWKPPGAAPEVLRFSLSVAGLGGGLFRSQSQVDFVFTHDGRALIYGSASGTGARFLSIRRLEQLSNTVIAGTEGAIGGLHLGTRRKTGPVLGSGRWRWRAGIDHRHRWSVSKRRDAGRRATGLPVERRLEGTE